MKTLPPSSNANLRVILEIGVGVDGDRQGAVSVDAGNHDRVVGIAAWSQPVPRGHFDLNFG